MMERKYRGRTIKTYGTLGDIPKDVATDEAPEEPAGNGEGESGDNPTAPENTTDPVADGAENGLLEG